MLSLRLTHFALLLAALAVTACDDPLGPHDVAGTYVLRSVRDEPLPAVLWETDHTQLRVLADTLRLNTDGTGAEIWVLEFVGAHASESGRSEWAVQFEVREGRLEGSYVCPASFCLTVFEPLRGEFTRMGLRLDVAKHGGGPLEFVRADR